MEGIGSSSSASDSTQFETEKFFEDAVSTLKLGWGRFSKGLDSIIACDKMHNSTK